MKNDSCKNSPPEQQKTRKREIKARLTISERTWNMFLFVCVCAVLLLFYLFLKGERGRLESFMVNLDEQQLRAYRDARETLDEFTPGGNEKLVTHKLPIINRRIFLDVG
jgi:hypothetical protein